MEAMLTRSAWDMPHSITRSKNSRGSFKPPLMQTIGCHWTGISLSMEQLKEAQQRVKAAGVSDCIALLYCDYRELPGLEEYDAVISCEMIEAVGHDHLPSFFSTIGRMLKPGGRAILQVCFHVSVLLLTKQAASMAHGSHQGVPTSRCKRSSMCSKARRRQSQQSNG